LQSLCPAGRAKDLTGSYFCLHFTDEKPKPQSCEVFVQSHSLSLGTECKLKVTPTLQGPLALTADGPEMTQKGTQGRQLELAARRGGFLALRGGHRGCPMCWVRWDNIDSYGGPGFRSQLSL
jgi:hypothetical protein